MSDTLDSAANESGVIYASTKQQALDWSLVLSSQEIACVVERDANGSGWLLLVDAGNRDRALAILRQYRLENRGWGWRQDLPWSGITFHWGVLGWVLTLCMFYYFANNGHYPLNLWGQLDSKLVKSGQWWRLITAECLHADLGHLSANMTTGCIFLGLAMARFGVGWALLATCLAGALGNVLGVIAYLKPYTSVGASGVVMAALGMVAVHSATLFRKNPRAFRILMSGVLSGVMLFILLGLSPDSDVLAHLGGFLGGIFLGLVLAFFPESWLHSKLANYILLGCLSGLLWFAWHSAVLVKLGAH